MVLEELFWAVVVLMDNTKMVLDTDMREELLHLVTGGNMNTKMEMVLNTIADHIFNINLYLNQYFNLI